MFTTSSKWNTYTLHSHTIFISIILNSHNIKLYDQSQFHNMTDSTQASNHVRRCRALSGVWHGEVIISAFVVDAFALLFTLITAWVWISVGKRNATIKKVLPWYTYGSLLILRLV
jgi:hypothetical protein